MQKREVSHLEYLDGLRGLAAFYVVLFHAGVCFPSGELPSLWRDVRRGLSFGHDAVAVFIVLSGYCLMIPASRRDGRLAHGVAGYLGRRAWRILPPYYAALLISLAVIAIFPAMHVKTGTIWDDTYPAFAVGPIVSHLVVVHNLFPSWVHTINGPLWSVATEWQIYFFFPFLLLPIWRRFGSAFTVCAGFIVGCLPLWIAPSVAGSSAPWYLGLFALGMCASGVGFSPRVSDAALRARPIWPWIWRGFLGASVLGMSVFVKFWFRHMPLSDALVGATTASLLVHYTRHALSEGRRPFGLRMLESRPLVLLGRFSYSLYLTHLLVVAGCYFALRNLALSPGLELAALLACGVPASLLAGYLFHLAIERRFLAAPAPFAPRP